MPYHLLPMILTLPHMGDIIVGLCTTDGSITDIVNADLISSLINVFNH